MRSRRPIAVACATLAVLAFALVGLVADSPGAPRTFDTPQAAAEALLAALEANDDAALEALTGAGAADIIQSGKDPVVARERKRVARAGREKLAFEDLEDGTKVALLGFQEWPLPVTLATKDGRWFFDAAAGRDELLARRIGANELHAMEVLRTLVDAQAEYVAKDRDGDGVLEYAQRLVSNPGKKDGLHWPDPAAGSPDERSPLGAELAEHAAVLAKRQKGDPWGGYVYKLLTSQSAAVPGGCMSYLAGENLTGGFAVLAVPAEHRNTGVMSFMISHRGRLFERDLGPQGLETAKTITEFHPDATWVKVGEP